jgi:hypothetical protein
MMNRYGGPHDSLTLALLGGLHLAITMDRYGGPQTARTIALLKGLFLAIIMDRYAGPRICPYYSLACRPLVSY